MLLGGLGDNISLIFFLTHVTICGDVNQESGKWVSVESVNLLTLNKNITFAL